MTLLVLRYHRSRAGADGNALELLDSHFRFIAEHYPSVLPGDPLPPERDVACLTFDGAFFDFYVRVFPLLQKHGLRALLAVAPAVIRDKAGATAKQRLEIATADAYARPNTGGFCTWEELQELASSQAIGFGAHGYMHRALDEPDADFETEVHVPHTLLAARLKVPVESFVLPFGRSTSAAIAEIKTGYRYVFGNGEATNSDWNARILYRISGDNLGAAEAPFGPRRLLSYRARAVWNRVRRR